MANKRYYWLKLKEDFFTQKEIKRLRRLAGGDTYTIIYLKLLLLSLKNEGKVFFDDVGDDFADELSIDIDEDVDNIKMTLGYLQQKGLLELVNQDEMYFNSIKSMIGSESESAERVRKHRRNLRISDCEETKKLQCNAEVTNSNTEIEKEKELELYKELLELEKEEKPKKPTRHKYGEYSHVLLDDEQLTKLKDKFPSDYKDRIKRLDEYIEMTGKKYKNHYLTIIKWAEKDKPHQPENSYSHLKRL